MVGMFGLAAALMRKQQGESIDAAWKHSEFSFEKSKSRDLSKSLVGSFSVESLIRSYQVVNTPFEKSMVRSDDELSLVDYQKENRDGRSTRRK